MTETPQLVPQPAPETVNPARDWRFPLSIGLAIGMAMGVSRGVQTNLDPIVGYWGAFAAGLVAAAAVGAIVSLAVYWIMKPRAAKPV